jgi:putative hydroxymethylpyrimidine transport system substrate-binding protein
MSRSAASLAAVLVALALAGCGDDGAEPDVPSGGASVSLVLDYQPNAVHAGIYSAIAEGDLEAEGIDLEVHEPGQSTDAPKLLRAGRVDLAVMDIHDLAIARDQGVDLVGIGALVQRPLAAVIAADRDKIRKTTDLFGSTIGVTGLPSDDAVLAAILDSVNQDAIQPDVVTIGFGSVAALSAGKVDAATAFWNAEGVALQRLDVPIRVFRVDDYGAPRYPELVLATSAETLRDDPGLVSGVKDATARGYDDLDAHGDEAIDALLQAVPDLDPDEQRAQFAALTAADAFAGAGELDRGVLEEWARWDLQNGILSKPLDVDAAFPPVGDA